jgi:hypothetical protein
MLRITIASLLVTACTVGEDAAGVHVGALDDGSDAGSCPSGDCDPSASPPTTPGGGSGSGSATVYADTTEGCTTNYPALPAGCIVYRGDRDRMDPEWLNCYYENGYATPVGCMLAGGIGASCELSDLTIAVISADCNTRLTSADKIMCAMDGIRTAIGGGNGTNGNVCRHFGRCFKKVYEAMGYAQSVMARWLGVIDLKGHTFNVVPTTGGGQYFVDSSNNIMYWCP